MNPPPTILIIEDEKSLREALAEKLKHEGYATLEAVDGEEGLTAALGNTPALILLDILMPKMDGLTMLKELRKANNYGKNVPVIILTNLSADNEKTVSSVLETEPSYYLVKADWKIQEVIDTVKEHLKEHAV